MGKLSQFTSEPAGYFREGADEDFPWEVEGKSVWYSLLALEEGKIARYGFTSSMSSKARLRKALESLAKTESVLLGVWNGQYSTSLFVLNIGIAIGKLPK